MKQLCDNCDRVIENPMLRYCEPCAQAFRMGQLFQGTDDTATEPKSREKEIQDILSKATETKPNFSKASKESGIPLSTLWDHWQRTQKNGSSQWTNDGRYKPEPEPVKVVEKKVVVVKQGHPNGRDWSKADDKILKEWRTSLGSKRPISSRSWGKLFRSLSHKRTKVACYYRMHVIGVTKKHACNNPYGRGGKPVTTTPEPVTTTPKEKGMLRQHAMTPPPKGVEDTIRLALLRDAERKRERDEEEKELQRKLPVSDFPTLWTVQDKDRYTVEELLKNLYANGGSINFYNHASILGLSDKWSWRKFVYELVDHQDQFREYFGVKKTLTMRLPRDNIPQVVVV